MSITLHSGENSTFLTNKPLNPVHKNTHGTRQTLKFKNPPIIIGRSTVAGSKEGKGPIGSYFHEIVPDDKMGEKSFERAELKMLENSVRKAIANANLRLSDVDLLLAGDLLNQITSSSYIARELRLPYLGVYSACSTMSQSLLMASSLIDAGHFNVIACATSSHFSTAERQYRYPLEYGCQRPPYAQWTVTGAGCTVLASSNYAESQSNFAQTQENYTQSQVNPKITMALTGKVVDFGVDDINNMGAAMAPAAMDSILTLFKENNLSADDFDLIVTGDLGKLGSDILRDLMREQGYDLGQKYIDCGGTIFSLDQNCYQGGSGAACSATVVNSFVLDKMMEGAYKKVAFFATGALMSPLTTNQGETMPCISHGVVIEM